MTYFEVRSKDASVCSCVYLHLDGRPVVDLDSCIDLVRVTAHAINRIDGGNGI